MKTFKEWAASSHCNEAARQETLADAGMTLVQKLPNGKVVLADADGRQSIYAKAVLPKDKWAMPYSIDIDGELYSFENGL